MSKKTFLSRIPGFISEVRQEARKVIWPTWKETSLTTRFVFLFAAVAAVFFACIDAVFYRLIGFILSL